MTHGDAAYGLPTISPDGKSVAAIRFTYATPAEAERMTLVLLDAETGDQRTLAAAIDRRPEHIVWGPDASTLYFTADDEGLHSAYRVDLPDGTVTRLTAAGAVTDLCPTPDGTTIYALQSTMTSPPRIVRFDARTPDQAPTEIVNRIDERGISAHGVVERLTTTAEDGTQIGAWLLRPPSATADAPAPLVVFVHGGPLGTWSRLALALEPHLLAERGYAVLMPDPAISTGLRPGVHRSRLGPVGREPYTDMMAAVDGALERPDLDASRTALMGGSFGGYMANWVAGHTDRFSGDRHARLAVGAARLPRDDRLRPRWEHEFGDPYVDAARYLEHSPAPRSRAIRTPMLVIHGERDHRVPISEALRAVDGPASATASDAKFLYFPDENHWVLKPQNARLWYETVLAFLDQHVRGIPFERDPLLGG